MKGIIFYTDNRIQNPIRDKVRHFIKEAGLPIVSTSLQPIDMGKNIVMHGRQRSYPTYIMQIMTALANLDTKYVFFCEHDVLYHKSHFDFTPPRDDVFYYNDNVWRWKLWDFKLIRYDKMRPLSCLACNRELALNHYRERMKHVMKLGLDEFRSREPRQGRIWGYEPGTKSRRRGGFSDEPSETWSSAGPNIDIRHNRTFTSIKCDLSEFKNKPENWQEINYKDVPDWDLRALFPIGMDNHSSHTQHFYGAVDSHPSEERNVLS